MANRALMQQQPSANCGDKMAVFQSFPSGIKQQISITKTKANHFRNLISITELATPLEEDYRTRLN